MLEKGPLDVPSKSAFTVSISLQKWLKISIIVDNITNFVLTTYGDATSQFSCLQAISLIK